MYKILLAGQDFRLLATRAAVLEKANAKVVCCNAAETLKILECEAFDLIVLCHSLAETDAARITIATHRRWPRTRILMIISGMSRERFYRGVKFDATSPPDPGHLIRNTTELLEALPDHHIEETMQLAYRQIAS